MDRIYSNGQELPVKLDYEMVDVCSVSRYNGIYNSEGAERWQHIKKRTHRIV